MDTICRLRTMNAMRVFLVPHFVVVAFIRPFRIDIRPHKCMHAFVLRHISEMMIIVVVVVVAGIFLPECVEEIVNIIKHNMASVLNTNADNIVNRIETAK